MAASVIWSYMPRPRAHNSRWEIKWGEPLTQPMRFKIFEALVMQVYVVVCVCPFVSAVIPPKHVFDFICKEKWSLDFNPLLQLYTCFLTWLQYDTRQWFISCCIASVPTSESDRSSLLMEIMSLCNLESKNVTSRMFGGSGSQSLHIITASIWLWTISRFMLNWQEDTWETYWKHRHHRHDVDCMSLSLSHTHTLVFFVLWGLSLSSLVHVLASDANFNHDN